jgi:hypothetical protein
VAAGGILRETLLNPPAVWSTLDLIAANGIYATAQPNFLYNLESCYVETLERYRLEHVNPISSALERGVFLMFSSDNLPIEPLVGLHAAVTRKRMSGKVYGKEEAVSITDAIRMYTRAGAHLSWDETRKGSLEAGKFADMIVLDHDPLTGDPEELLKASVDLTIVGGKVVYDRSLDPGANLQKKSHIKRHIRGACAGSLRADCCAYGGAAAPKAAGGQRAGAFAHPKRRARVICSGKRVDFVL